MNDVPPLENLEPDRVFDGGDLDCGSGLVLLLRNHMRAVPDGGVLEMRSSEPTVRDDLPPWCRMVGHEYLGAIDTDRFVRYFLRRGTGEAAEAEDQALEDDKARAAAYEWRVRARSTGALECTAYCRNFSIKVGQAASFKEKDEHPSAVELVLAALAGALTTAFATECAQAGLEVDDIEITARGTLHDPLAHVGVQEGDPSFDAIQVKCFASTFDDEGAVKAAWARTVSRSPIAATLAKGVELETKLALV